MVLCGFINWGGAGRGEMVEQGMAAQRVGGREREWGHNRGMGGCGGGGGEPHQVLIDFLQL